MACALRRLFEAYLSSLSIWVAKKLRETEKKKRGKLIANHVFSKCGCKLKRQQLLKSRARIKRGKCVAINLGVALMQIVVGIIVIAPVLWLSGRAVVGKGKKQSSPRLFG